ncbi:YihY/virulence factor BrkB family protein [Salinibacillus xinjiangensis]|uniref:YihY family inner membrane protein n=1 Tax=Salinibacillus xinjiangensis TaxID=1229268 RepID=A0A6G1X8X0_9BACI|nr:YihY/virulence factor BrkB family protein [Salinibacillus xinjiangensis]MRG87451.1 YihY family inner membrane protein [Salinibacillus xinjiangensis]
MLRKFKLFFKRMFKRYFDDDVGGRAAQLSYFFLLSLFPFIIFLLTLVGYIPITVENILSLVEQFAPGDTMVLIEENVDNLMKERNGQLLSIGLITTLFIASNGVNALVRVINLTYEVEETRSFIVARLISIVLTVAMFFVIIIALLLPVFGKLIGTYIFSFFGANDEFLQVWGMLRWVISIVVMGVIFTFLYKLAPEKRVTITEALPGAIFATLGWQTVSLIFAFYVENFGHYSNTYGSLGVVIVLMIWLYLSALIIILGGEMNATLYKMKRKGLL